MPEARHLWIVIPCLTLLFSGPAVAATVDGTPPNFVPRLVLSYADPESGETISCAEDCRRMEVPDGVVLEARVEVRNDGGGVGDEGVPWDLWFDQRRYPFPGIELSACFDESLGRVDVSCWQALNERVGWDEWSQAVADVVCVPEHGSECREAVVRVPMDADFEGSRGRGVYSFAVWVDRFRVFAESDEFDNFRGPVRVKVVPREGHTAGEVEDTAATAMDWLVERPSVPQPYTVVLFPDRLENGFSLSSLVSRGGLEFAPLYPGTVTVEVVQTGSYETMVVEVRKVSTDELLVDAIGKGKLQIDGRIGMTDLMGDRRLEVVVKPGPGTRGVRGSISVEYPGRAVYHRTE